MLIAQIILMLALASLGTVADAAEQTSRAGARAAADSADVLPFHAREKTLANGLKVIVVPTGFPNIVSIQIPVQTGSRNEVEPGKSGFAHFFEHMMSRGTKAYPPEKYQQILTTMGARQNAYTTDDYTNYHTTFAKEDLGILLAVEADRFQNLAYSEEAFKTEARAVLGEYNKGSADPSFKLFEAMRKAAYLKHTYRHTTMGFLEDIEDMPNQYAYSKTFFDRWYRPENTTLIIAGDVNASEIFPLVEKYWGKWKRGSYRGRRFRRNRRRQGRPILHVSWSSPTLPLVWVAFHAPAFQETVMDHAALDTLLGLSSAGRRSSTSSWSKRSRRLTSSAPSRPAGWTRRWSVIAVRVKKAGKHGLRSRRNPQGGRATADHARRRHSVSPTPRPRASMGSFARSTTPIRSPPHSRGFVRYRRALRDDQRVLPDGRQLLTPRRPLCRPARKYFTDEGIVVATLAHDPLPSGIADIPKLASMAVGGGRDPDVRVRDPEVRFAADPLQAPVHRRLGAGPARQRGTRRIDGRHGGPSRFPRDARLTKSREPFSRSREASPSRSTRR